MSWLVTYFYQPFFNILVGIYWTLSQISPDLTDMGIAVIIFSIIIRVLTLPLTISSERSEEDKSRIVKKVEELKQQYAHEPILLKKKIRETIRASKIIVTSTTINLIIQLGIILMLYRIFTTGLSGEDFYLLYDFMPTIERVNLIFLGKYDLTQPSLHLNLIQSLMIFVVELLIAIRSPVSLSKRDVALMQFIMPLGSFIIFMFLPAGKKLFIITSLAFSAGYLVIKIIKSWGKKLNQKLSPPEKTLSSQDSQAK